VSNFSAVLLTPVKHSKTSWETLTGAVDISEEFLATVNDTSNFLLC
jgi:hypothetical protein